MDETVAQDEAIHEWLWWLRHQADGLYLKLYRRPHPDELMPPEAASDDMVGVLARRMAETDWVRSWQSGPERQELSRGLEGCSTATARLLSRLSTRDIHASIVAEGRASGNPRARKAAKAAKARVTAEKVTPKIRADILRWRAGKTRRGLGWIVAELRKRYGVNLGRGTVDKIGKGAPSPSGS